MQKSTPDLYKEGTDYNRYMKEKHDIEFLVAERFSFTFIDRMININTKLGENIKFYRYDFCIFVCKNNLIDSSHDIVEALWRLEHQR
jgi:hypothetical protein